MKKCKFLKLLNSLLYILMFLIIINNSLGYLDPDLGWHIKVGESIYQEQAVPHINHYNFVFSDNDNFWVDHEWLSNLLTYLIYDNFGYLSLTLFFALILFFTLLILNQFIFNKISSQPIFKTLLIILEIILIKGILPSSGIRIQELSWLFFILLLLIIYNFEDKVILKKKKPWLILGFLIPLFFLWTNSHGSFILGPVILFIYIIVKAGEIIIFKSNCKLKSFFDFSRTLEKQNILHLSLALILSSAISLINPYGLKLFDFLFIYSKNTAYLRIIAEWFSPFSFPLVPWNLIYLVIFLVVFIYFFIINKKKEELQFIRQPWNLALNLIFLILFLKSKRHFPLFFIVSFPSLVTILWSGIKNIFSNIKFNHNGKIDIFLKIFIITSIIISGMAILLKTNFHHRDPFKSFCGKYPCYAVNFLQKHHQKYLNKKLFNNYNWGGYLIHEYPEKQIFIDGRLPQKTLKNHSYIEEYLLFSSESEEIIKEKLDEYDIELVLISKETKKRLNWLEQILLFKNTKILVAKNNLKDFLNKDSNWILIYEDQTSIIYEKIN
ncbi:MAG: hypothetical protein ACOXZ1_00130 [Patescibacteria group bacterium]|jgi:hypothetical protein